MSSPADRPGPGTGRDASRDDLLAYLSSNTLDADYALVAARRGPRGRKRTLGDSTPPGVRRSGAVRALVLAAFGALVVTLFTQTSQDADSVDNERGQLVSQVDGQQKRLDERRAEVARLSADNDRLGADLLSITSSGVIGRTGRLGRLAGTVAVRGPGVLVEVDDAPGATSARNRVLDSDLQQLVNGYWQAGAEAIAINGERLTNLSSIRLAGDAINVNFVGLTAPYAIEVVGDPDTLPGRFAESTSGSAWFDLQRRVGLQFSMRTRSSMTLPAADRASLSYATATDTGTDDGGDDS